MCSSELPYKICRVPIEHYCFAMEINIFLHSRILKEHKYTIHHRIGLEKCIDLVRRDHKVAFN
jgi:hypothetical protein